MAERKKNRRRLTPKMRRVLNYVVQNPDATLREIGTACDLSPTNPKSAAHRLINHPNVQARMSALMEKFIPLQDEALLKKLAEGLDATNTQFFSHEGEVTDERELVDFPTRKEYLALALRVKGAMKEYREISGPDGGPIAINSANPIPPAILEMSKDELIEMVRRTNP